VGERKRDRCGLRSGGYAVDVAVPTGCRVRHPLTGMRGGVAGCEHLPPWIQSDESTGYGQFERPASSHPDTCQVRDLAVPYHLNFSRYSTLPARHAVDLHGEHTHRCRVTERHWSQASSLGAPTREPPSQIPSKHIHLRGGSCGDFGRGCLWIRNVVAIR
jgi:hypothetical protein